MKSRLLITALVLLSISLQSNATENDAIVATVNGIDIKQSTVELYTQERQQVNPQLPSSNEDIINDLVNMTLLNEDARKNKVHQSSEYKSRLEFIAFNLLSQAAMDNFLDNNPVSEEKLKAEYDTRIGGMNFVEYKASHILLKDPEAAKKVIAELDKGGKFDEIAKKYSTGPTGPKGGDLGWFNPRQMVPEFSEAVIALKDNEYTKQAVKTQFGLHVILRSGERKGTPPSFEQTKPRIATFLEQQQIQAHINGLRKDAKVDIKK